MLQHKELRMTQYNIPTKKLRMGFELPVLGLGTWMMGGDINRDPNNNDAADIKAIETAIDFGITHIDTAEIYAAGFAEKITGQGIKKFDRKTLTIASKIPPQNQRHDDLLRNLDASLERLETDYLDIYYLHQPSLEIPLEETAKALNKAVKDGKVKHVAVSNFNPERLDRLQALLDTKIVANQLHYNLVFREPAHKGVLEHCIEKDYLLVAWRPIRFEKRGNPNAPHKNVWEQGAYPLLDEISAKYKKSNVQTAINWVIGQPNVVTLVKSSKPANLLECISAIDWKLSDEDIERLKREFPGQESVSDTVPMA
ncbi:MAG: hypothetical protein GC136_03730 [Alphaproteobacteria bacterium]|nr:hypothetical protein [Alphaproteobacteria bacterium]